MEFAFPDISLPVVELKTGYQLSASNIDRENRMIKGVILCQVGEAKGYDMWIEQSFIEDMAKDIRKNLGSRVQCNMGHRWDNTFYQMGVFGGFKIDGDKLVADLTTYKAAEISPAGDNMVEWFYTLAGEDPKAVMMSIKVQRIPYQYNSAGQKQNLQFDYYNYEWLKIDPKAKVYMGYVKIKSCDIVDEGALTDSLFSETGDTDITAAFSDIVNTPGFMEWFKTNKSRFPILNKHYEEEVKFSLGKFFKKHFSKSQDNHKPMAEETKPAATPVVQENASAPDINALIEAAVKPIKDEISALTSQLSEKDKTIKEKDDEIEALKEKPAAEETAFKSDAPSRTDSEPEIKSYHRSPATLKAKAIAERASRN